MKQAAPKTRDLLFQQLGNDMADRFLGSSLMHEPDPLDLLAQLSLAQKSRTPTTPESSSSTTLTSSEPAIPTFHYGRPQFHFSQTSPTPDKDLFVDLSRGQKSGNIFTLDDFSAIAALGFLIDRYGRMAHMGILDKSYGFFLTKDKAAALYFKVKGRVAVVGGDPLCQPDQLTGLLEEFKAYRKKKSLGIAFLGASDWFATYARDQGWVTMHFAEERVLNPMTNPVLLGTSGKRIVGQTKQLLDPKKGNLVVSVYSPATGTDIVLQNQLASIYDSWREERNRQRKNTAQAFITVYDPFAMPGMMTYIYTRGADGQPNGFAALRKLSTNSGFHLDPCIAAPGAPRGLTDLLIFSTMSFLNRAGISYLSLGYEPMRELGDITGMPRLVSKLAYVAYRRAFHSLPISGKKTYHDKFYPDDDQLSKLYIIFPDGVPGPRHSAAVMHVANIRMRRIMGTNFSKASTRAGRKDSEPVENKGGDKSARGHIGEEALV